jgi:cyanate permease
LLMFAGFAGLLNGLLYTSLAPLIPELVREVGLSTTQVGVMAARPGW